MAVQFGQLQYGQYASGAVAVLRPDMVGGYPVLVKARGIVVVGNSTPVIIPRRPVTF